MDINVKIWLSNSPVYENQLNEIERMLAKLMSKGEVITMTLNELKAQVAANTAVEASAIELIKGIAARLDDLKDDPTEIAALAEELRASATALGDAVSANTPKNA